MMDRQLCWQVHHLLLVDDTTPLVGGYSFLFAHHHCTRAEEVEAMGTYEYRLIDYLQKAIQQMIGYRIDDDDNSGLRVASVHHDESRDDGDRVDVDLVGGGIHGWVLRFPHHHLEA